MSDAYDIAVVGATGLVGETILEILAQREFPVGEVHALASSRSAGNTVQFRGRPTFAMSPTFPSLSRRSTQRPLRATRRAT
jgi:aspartate-semialdehyde dehydrogenase